MENDDKPIGQILSRRDALRFLGVGGAAFLVACSSQGSSIVETTRSSSNSSALGCVVRPELTIGPYFVDGQLKRSDIRSDPLEGNVSEGAPLSLTIVVSDVSHNSCKALEGAQVDVWHCDAMGIYSGVLERGFNTVGQKFLRGYQLTDSNGSVKFKTIYPGWYSGRAVHIHFTIRTRGTNGQDYQFTSQFFFDDKLTDIVHSRQPYVNKGQRNTRNSKDNLYRSGGDQLLLHARGNSESGYNAAINIGLDLSDVQMGASDLLGLPGGNPLP